MLDVELGMGDGRLIAVDLLLEAGHLRRIFGLARAPDRELQGAVGITLHLPIRLAFLLGVQTADLGGKPAGLGLQGAEIGGGESRIERRQGLALMHDLSGAHQQAAHDGSFQGLHHQIGLVGNRRGHCR